MGTSGNWKKALIGLKKPEKDDLVIFSFTSFFPSSLSNRWFTRERTALDIVSSERFHGEERGAGYNSDTNSILEISEKWSGKTMIRELDGLWIEIIVMATSKAGSKFGHLPESLIPGLSGGFLTLRREKKG